MAEALGVAASGIAIAQISTQVGGTVLKLKRLWDEVKDVPDDIADLMEQIECLDPTIWEIENSFNQSGLPPLIWDELASRSTTVYCRKALQNLTGMVDELSLYINNAKKGRRKIAAIKVLLKKDSLRKLERRLENAVGMLSLAQQSYHVVLIESFGSGRTILLQAPTWLSQRSWELHSTKANGNWQWNLRSYSIVPMDSKVIELAVGGTPQDMQKLFDAGLASPYDCDQFGWTLLLVRKYRGRNVINHASNYITFLVCCHRP
ncbi:hypothetical protein K449DRAFT_322913 [Hypoxylon sp. EC38]|nr:hypothetical protein K449DRAFT_322913 [Hypoxylon sp. EC38]